MKTHIIFDLNETIIKKKHAYHELVKDFFIEQRISQLFDKMPGQSFDEIICQSISVLPPESLNGIYSKDNWVSVFTSALEKFGVPEVLNARHIAEVLYQKLSLPSQWVVFQDVMQTFNFLKESNISFGFLSNWDNRMASMWRQLSLDLGVSNEIALFSYQVGYCKPNPMLFKVYMDFAYQKHGDIDKFIYIGDDEKTDSGGVGLGVAFYQIDRRIPGFNLMKEIQKIVL